MRESIVLAGGSTGFPEDWSRDGRWIAVGLRQGPFQVALIPVGGGEPVQFLERNASLTRADEMHFSPDGRWLAFNAQSGDRQEVFVVPLPPTGQRWQVSTAGGMQPRWHPSGRTLHFLDPNGMMMAVEIAGGATFSAGTPRALFDIGFSPSYNFDEYRVAPDGRFLVKKPRAQGALRVIVNWQGLLGQ
jgi:eukaryotic-like serine/threonine-protein kinase